MLFQRSISCKNYIRNSGIQDLFLERTSWWNMGWFKAASTVVNRNHQQHFEELKEVEQQPLTRKQWFAKLLRPLNITNWQRLPDGRTRRRRLLHFKINGKTIGFAPQKMNVKIFERFRKSCDDFFKKEERVLQQLKDNMVQNLERKRFYAKSRSFER